MSIALIRSKIKQLNKIEAKFKERKKGKFKVVFAYNNLKELNQQYANSEQDIIIFNIGNSDE